jgi:hypothetical protein
MQRRALKALKVWHIGLGKHFGHGFEDDISLLPECSTGLDELPTDREGSGEYRA